MDFEIIKAMYFLLGFAVGVAYVFAVWHFIDWRNGNIEKHKGEIKLLKKSLLARLIRFVRGY